MSETAVVAKPIPPGTSPGQFGRVVTPDAEPEQELQADTEVPEGDEPEPEPDDQPESKPYRFAGREWKTQAEAEAAFGAMRGRENPKDKRIAELEKEVEQRNSQMEMLERSRTTLESGEKLTKDEKQEVKSFLQTLSQKDVEQFTEDEEAKGTLYALSRVLGKMESFQGDQIKKLRESFEELKRTTIDEPAAVQEASKKWSEDLFGIASQARKIAEEGEGPWAEAFAQVFPPDADPETQAKNFDEVHQIMLGRNLNADEPEDFALATCAWIGFNSLSSVKKPRSSTPRKARAAVDEDEETEVFDPSLSGTRGGARPPKRGDDSGYLGDTQSAKRSPFGKGLL